MNNSKKPVTNNEFKEGAIKKSDNIIKNRIYFILKQFKEKILYTIGNEV